MLSTTGQKTSLCAALSGLMNQIMKYSRSVRDSLQEWVRNQQSQIAEEMGLGGMK